MTKRAWLIAGVLTVTAAGLAGGVLAYRHAGNVGAPPEQRTGAPAPSSAALDPATPVLPPTTVRAEATETSSPLSGRVTDEYGQAIPGAEIKAASEGLLRLTPVASKLCDCGCGDLLIECTCARAKEILPRFIERARSEPQAQAVVTADDEGRYAFEDLAPDNYRVWAVAPGRAISSHADLRITDRAAGLDFALTAAGQVTGEVRDRSGRPVPAAKVIAVSAAEVGGLARTRADTEGRFRLDGLTSGPYYVYASAKGYAPTVEREVSPGAELRIDLRAGGSIAGLVEDEHGPVGGATVHVVGAEGHGVPTGSDGSFRMDGLEPGTKKVWAELGERVSEETRSVELAVGETREDLRLRLVEGGRVEGRVASEQDDEGIGGAHIQLRRAHRGTIREVYSDTDGSFRILGIPPDVYDVAVTAEGWSAPDSPTLTIDASERRHLDLRMGRGGTLVGRVVTPEGAPVLGASVTAKSYGGGAANQLTSTKSDEEGRFRFEGLAGMAMLAATAPGRAKVETWVTGLNTGTPVEVELVLAVGMRVSGIVEGPDGGIAGAKIWFEGTPESEPEGTGQHGAYLDEASVEVRSGAGGRFTAEGVPPGEYQVHATARGMISGEQGPIIVAAGRPVEGVRILLQPGRELSGTVTDANEVPVVRASISWGDSSASSDGAGHFRLDGLPVETHDLTVEATGFEAQVLAGIASGTEKLEIELVPSGVLTGRVVADATGRPVTAFTVNYREMRDRKGAFRYRELDETEKWVTVSAPGFTPTRIGPYSARSGVTIDAGIVSLARESRIRGRVVDGSGNAIAGAMVAATSPNSSADSAEAFDENSFSGSTTANTDGEFDLGGLGPGTWALSAYAETGYATRTIDLGTGEVVEGVLLTVDEESMAAAMEEAMAALSPTEQTLAAVSQRVFEELEPDMREELSMEEIFALVEEALEDEERTPELEELLESYRAMTLDGPSASP